MNKLREAVAESLTLSILVVSLAIILKRIEFRMKVTLPYLLPSREGIGRTGKMPVLPQRRSDKGRGI